MCIRDSPVISLTGIPDERLTDEITYGTLGNNTPWNDGSDAPAIDNADSVFVVLMSTPVTGTHPTFPVLDGGASNLNNMESADSTHFITQTGYKPTEGLTATELSSIQFTADTLTGAPLGRAYDYVFGYQPWSHHLSVSGLGLSGSTASTKVLGLTGFNEDGGYYANGSTVSATFLSLKGKSTYTYLTATSTYAVTGDDVYPDTTFHMSTRPALTGNIAWDLDPTIAFDSGTHRIRIFELMPTGTIAENKWIVTRQVISKPDLNWSSSDFSTPSYEVLSSVNHPFTESLSADTTDKVRYLYIDEYDGDSGDSVTPIQIDSLKGITIQTYTDDGLNRDGGTPDAGTGELAPTWEYRTKELSDASG